MTYIIPLTEQSKRITGQSGAKRRAKKGQVNAFGIKMEWSKLGKFMEKHMECNIEVLSETKGFIPIHCEQCHHVYLATMDEIREWLIKKGIGRNADTRLQSPIDKSPKR